MPAHFTPPPEAPGRSFSHDFSRCVRRDIEYLLRTSPSRWKSVQVVLTNRGLQAMLLYRLSRSCRTYHVPLIPLILARLSQFLFAVDISPQADLGPGIVIVHGFGVVIGAEVRIEGDCCIFHGVTIGDRGSEWVSSTLTDGHPYVERGVMFGAGAKVLGPIRIGHNSVVGANAVVLRAVPSDSVVAGVPARVVGRNQGNFSGHASPAPSDEAPS